MDQEFGIPPANIIMNSLGGQDANSCLFNLPYGGGGVLPLAF